MQAPPKLTQLVEHLDRAWRRHPFSYALGLSILAHLIFLSFRWGIGEIENRRLNTPLSVVLVNASNPVAPKQANKLAQADLNGGGNTSNQDSSALQVHSRLNQRAQCH